MSWAIWITGLPGSGKSTIARGVVAALRDAHEPAQLLELDAIRKILTPAPTHSSAEREMVYRALVHLAATLTEANVPVIIDATAHRRDWRNLARAVIPRFAEVQLSCPLAVCIERERTRQPGSAPREIYARAGRPHATVPGVDVPYEPAVAPEMTVDTESEHVDAAVLRIVGLAHTLGRDVRMPLQSSTDDGWAIWITGLPGSGKTTLAHAVAEALIRDHVPVKVLDLASLESIAPAMARGMAWEELACRTLAYAAPLLTAHGVAVIVDATAPRRAWRDLARSLVSRFGEVQLLCPLAVCCERERAVRWRLGAGTRAGLRPELGAWPDVVLEYEHAINPELIVRTDVQHVGSALGDVMRLAARLRYDTAAQRSERPGAPGALLEPSTPRKEEVIHVRQ